MDDAAYMRRALELARRAEGSVSPRPPVGALVVAGDEVAGEGFTKPVPGPHAEAEALEAAGSRARGATLYVTLEPCTRSSVSVSCADRILDSGLRRVVAATRDPNPDVNGRGFRAIRRAGIDVRTGVLRAPARALIEPFAKWITTARPFVTLKLAMSLDGKVAAPDGSSRWITGELARAEVHDLRRRVDAIVVGAGTVEADDPLLTFRLSGIEGTQPLRVVIDSSGRTRPGARIFDDSAPTLVLGAFDIPGHVTEAWTRHRAAVAALPRADGGVDLAAALGELGRRGVCHVLVEAGPTLAGSFADAGLVDRYIFYIAPKLIGGDAPGVFATGVKTLADAWELDVTNTRRVGADIRVDARPR